MTRFPDKDPKETLDYTASFADLFEPDETIATVAWTVSPTGELVINSQDKSGQKASVTVSAGTKGKVYTLEVTVTTNKLIPILARKFNRKFQLRLKDL